MAAWQEWPQIGLGTPATYRIVVRGHLEPSWSDQLGGLAIHSATGTEKLPTTTLTGLLVDQAALFGVLDKLYGLGFVLLSVECLVTQSS